VTRKRSSRLYCRLLSISAVTVVPSRFAPAASSIVESLHGARRCLLSDLFTDHTGRISCRVAKAQCSILSLSSLQISIVCEACHHVLVPPQTRCCGQTEVQLALSGVVDDGTAQGQCFAEGEPAWQMVAWRPEERAGLIDRLAQAGPLSLKHGVREAEDSDLSEVSKAAHSYLERLVGTGAKLPRQVELAFRPNVAGPEGYRGKADAAGRACTVGVEWKKVRLGKANVNMRVLARTALNVVAVGEADARAEAHRLLARRRGEPPC